MLKVKLKELVAQCSKHMLAIQTTSDFFDKIQILDLNQTNEFLQCLLDSFHVACNFNDDSEVRHDLWKQG